MIYDVSAPLYAQFVFVGSARQVMTTLATPIACLTVTMRHEDLLQWRESAMARWG